MTTNNDGGPERIWIESDGECPYFYLEEELSDVASPITQYVRADKLQAEIEALRVEVERLRKALALLPDEHDMIEHNPDEGPRMFCCWGEMKFRGLHDVLITHDEECWYARMRALLSAVERDAPEVAL